MDIAWLIGHQVLEIRERARHRIRNLAPPMSGVNGHFLHGRFMGRFRL
jgi:hypothetical protein